MAINIFFVLLGIVLLIFNEPITIFLLDTNEKLAGFQFYRNLLQRLRTPLYYINRAILYIAGALLVAGGVIMLFTK